MTEESMEVIGGPRRSVLVDRAFEINPSPIQFMIGSYGNAHIISIKIGRIECIENNKFLKIIGVIQEIDGIREKEGGYPECHIIYLPERNIGELGFEEEKKEKEKKFTFLNIQIGR